MVHLLAWLLLTQPSFAAPAVSANWAQGSDLDPAALAAAVPATAHRSPQKGALRRYCIPKRGMCWGGNGGSDCCSHHCSVSVVFLYGSCF